MFAIRPPPFIPPSNILRPHHHHNLPPSLPRHYRTMPNVRGLSESARELADSGQYEKALEFVSKEIKTDANNANAWYNKGILPFKMCRHQDARNSFAFLFFPSLVLHSKKWK
jgi:tetratricopeptide (TPR) repeat protein